MLIEGEVETLYKKMGGHDGIRAFIRPFYMDIRQHHLLGPIFNSRIDDWDSHLDKITEFWALQTGGPSQYRGGFAGAHMRLGIQKEHFTEWLKLWDFNCRRQLSEELARPMSGLAHEMAARLSRIT